MSSVITSVVGLHVEDLVAVDLRLGIDADSWPSCRLHCLLWPERVLQGIVGKLGDLRDVGLGQFEVDIQSCRPRFASCSSAALRL